MRLDIFLRTSRLILRRSVAQELCDKGMVYVNGTSARASKDVKTGDILKIRNRNRVIEVSIREVPDKKQLSKADAPELYEIISNVSVNDDPLA